jgi:hypothetical protein
MFSAILIIGVCLHVLGAFIGGLFILHARHKPAGLPFSNYDDEPGDCRG